MDSKSRKPHFLDNVNNLLTGDSDSVDSDEEKEVLSNIRYLSKFYAMFTVEKTNQKQLHSFKNK